MALRLLIVEPTQLCTIRTPLFLAAQLIEHAISYDGQH